MPEPIALKLRVLREERGLTQKEAAELAKVSHWWRRSNIPYNSHGRSNFPAFPARDSARTSALRSSEKFVQQPATLSIYCGYKHERGVRGHPTRVYLPYSMCI
jgi:hypothetical protein